MNRFRLISSVIIGDVECPIDTDYRNIIEIFIILNDPDLTDEERWSIALDYFYNTNDYMVDIELALKYMVEFMNGGKESKQQKAESKPLFEWEKDFNLIVAPINKSMGVDIRGLEHMHWWTFLSAFMEIGECTFNTYVGIRDKINRGKKLEKHETKIYRDNREDILLPKRYDSTTQSLMEEILGKEK